jgi:hypothetical protein
MKGSETAKIVSVSEMGQVLLKEGLSFIKFNSAVSFIAGIVFVLLIMVLRM